MGKYPGECRLQILLDERGMTQAELCRRTGLSPSYLNGLIKKRWTKKGIVKLENARLICLALGIDNPFDLYEWLDEPPLKKELE